MPTITAIVPSPATEQVSVYVDRQFCCTVRARTFRAMSLEVGSQATCEQVKYLENFHWKIQYGPESWIRENHRLDRAIAMVNWADRRVVVHKVGFGAGTAQFIPEHPEESGVPDLALVLPPTDVLIARIEVTGTETMRGHDYWVRPDKLKYANAHPGENVWVVLHYSKPRERVVCIQPDLTREYEFEDVEIRGSIERYVKFAHGDPEVKTIDEFRQWLLTKVDSVEGGLIV